VIRGGLKGMGLVDSKLSLEQKGGRGYFEGERCVGGLRVGKKETIGAG